MAKSAELREQAQALADEIEALSNKEDPTETDLTRMAEAIEEARPLADEIRKTEAEERASALEVVRQFAAKPAHVEPAQGPDVIIREKRDPYDFSEVRHSALDERAFADEMRARARDAVEQAPEYVTDDQREAATAKVDRDYTGATAQYMLKHGSDEYRDAWFHYMATGEARAAMSTTNANGGFMIPFYLDPTIILTNTGSKNPFRQISRVETITTNVWHGVSSAGVTAEWTSEASEMTDASPTFSQPTVTPIRADAYIQASFEVVQDSNVAAQLGMLFSDAKDRLEAAAFAVGTGSTQPEGIVTRLSVTTASKVSAVTNATFQALDIFALVNSLPARYQDNCSWVGHWSVFNLVRSFTASASPQAGNFWVDLGPGIPSQLLGRPVYVSSSMQAAPLSTATASTDNILILGDWSNYLIVDRIGMEVVYNPLVLGTNRRPTGEVGWAAFWRVGADTTNADGFRMLVV